MRKNSNPVISETVTLEVTIAQAVEAGERELKLRTQIELSNPLVFCVGQLSEFSEAPPKVSIDPRENTPGRIGRMKALFQNAFSLHSIRLGALRQLRAFSPAVPRHTGYHIMGLNG